MAVFAFALAIVVILVSWYHAKFNRRNKLLAKLPSIKSYPLIGSNLSFIGKSAAQIFKTLEQASREHGPIWRFDLSPFNSNILVHDPKIVERILSSQKFLDKSIEYEFIKNWLNDGLLISTGKKWHQRRKIITPSFHFKILEHFTDVMEKQGQVFVANLKKLEGQHFDFFPMISLYALDVICESAMGCKINAQIDSESEYVTAVKEITNIVFLRGFDVFRRIDFFYRMTDMHKQEQKALKVLHGFTDSVICSRQKELAALAKTSQADKSIDEDENDIGIKKKSAFLDVLLQATIDGEPLKNEDVREEVDTFMFEGHDTTTSGIAFSLYILAKYPDVQKEVYKEIVEKLGDDLTKRVTMKDLNSLSYLELVIKEVLRLYPSVPFFGRIIHEELTVGDVTIPANSTVTMSPFFMGRDPSLFDKPLVFDPLRFNAETTAEKTNPFAYVPFSAGPRNCIGQKFAMLEMKSIVSQVIRNFEITIKPENEEIPLISQLILRPEHGLLLCANVRKTTQTNH